MLSENLEPIFRVLANSENGCTLVGSSAANEFPSGLHGALNNAGLIFEAPDSNYVICPGCHLACPMEVMRFDDELCVPCDKAEDLGLIPVSPNETKQWQITWRSVTQFVAKGLGLAAPKAGSIDVRTKLGRVKTPKNSWLAAIEFDDSVLLCVGDHRIALSDRVAFDGRRIDLDIDAIRLGAECAASRPARGQDYQSSKLKQEFGKQKTALRNRRLQEATDQLKHEKPSRTKLQIAEALIASGEFPGMTEARIMRIIRVRK